MRPCIWCRHEADTYVHVPVADYVRRIAEHLDYDGHLDDGQVGIYLCYQHLNLWLDIADDDPSMEPTMLAFETPPAGASSRALWGWWTMDPDAPYFPLRHGQMEERVGR